MGMLEDAQRWSVMKAYFPQEDEEQRGLIKPKTSQNVNERRWRREKKGQERQGRGRAEAGQRQGRGRVNGGRGREGEISCDQSPTNPPPPSPSPPPYRRVRRGRGKENPTPSFPHSIQINQLDSFQQINRRHQSTWLKNHRLAWSNSSHPNPVMGRLNIHQINVADGRNSIDVGDEGTFRSESRFTWIAHSNRAEFQWRIGLATRLPLISIITDGLIATQQPLIGQPGNLEASEHPFQVSPEHPAESAAESGGGNGSPSENPVGGCRSIHRRLCNYRRLINAWMLLIGWFIKRLASGR